ncbi:hypothetical protein LCGC14_1284060 [marine sediment metagenome]|uniref:Uncharacterized protein n=1 Tax=marine sediment metagenome TaxID=412755 RepID=A0A0F9LFF1_9ZZZZ
MAKKASRPPLTPLGDLLVLGGRYRFGRGVTWNKKPLMYMSIPHKPGLSVMADDLWAFHRKLGEMIELGFPELRGEPAPVELPGAATGAEEACLGPSNVDWRYINETEGGTKEAPELFVTHALKTAKDGTVCQFCTFDPAKVNMYKDLAHEMRLAEQGEPADETPTEKPKGRSPLNP